MICRLGALRRVRPGIVRSTAAPDFGVDVRGFGSAMLEDVDAVVHLAALSNDPIGDLDTGLTYAVNHKATDVSRRSPARQQGQAVRLRLVLQYVRRPPRR